MSALAVSAHGLGKRYHIGERRAGYRTLRETLEGAARTGVGAVTRRLRAEADGQTQDRDFWALRDISFDLEAGEVLGLIGPNGAGKSTLLKILSRVTEPTEGYVDLRGRVGSLLEVGTGFHQELTGRENIYLSGSILGMTRADIDRRFEEIVEFAGVSAFIDTPVKRYSSGMYLRLAFSVAAHLETDILIVDEVLAVGDAAFQEKCMGTMQRAARGGRTVIFVSHNMASIQHLCSQAILLRAGAIYAHGPAGEVVQEYLASVHPATDVSTRDWHDRISSGEARVVWFSTRDEVGRPVSSIPMGSDLTFRFEVEIYEPLFDPAFGVIVHSSAGEPMLDLRTIHAGVRAGAMQGTVLVEGTVRNIGLYPGRYLLSPWIMDAGCVRDIDFVKLCAAIEVTPKPGMHGDLKLDGLWGKYWVPSEWRVVDQRAISYGAPISASSSPTP